MNQATSLLQIDYSMRFALAVIVTIYSVSW